MDYLKLLFFNPIFRPWIYSVVQNFFLLFFSASLRRNFEAGCYFSIKKSTQFIPNSTGQNGFQVQQDFFDILQLLHNHNTVFISERLFEFLKVHRNLHKSVTSETGTDDRYLPSIKIILKINSHQMTTLPSLLLFHAAL